MPHRKTPLLLVLVFSCLPFATVAAAGAIGVEFEAFQFPGSWEKTGHVTTSDLRGASGGKWLFSGPQAPHPAATAVEIPSAGTYTLWVRSPDFPANAPGTRSFVVSVGGRESPRPFGRHGKSGWNWEKGGTFELPAGPALITLGVGRGKGFARADAMVLSSDPDFQPSGQGRPKGARWVDPVPVDSAQIVRPQISAGVEAENPERTALIGNKHLRAFLSRLGSFVGLDWGRDAAIENEYLRVRFVDTTRGGLPSVRPLIDVREGDGWREIPTDPSSESYQIVAASPDATMEINQFYPTWPVLEEIAVGGATVTTTRPADPVIWAAGENFEVIPRGAVADGPHAVVLDFHPTEAGTLQARWELPPGQETAEVTLSLVPAKKGQFSLGYHFPRSIKPEEAEEFLMPMMVQRKRFPDFPYTMLDACAPTPLSLVQTSDGAGPLTWGLAGDPSMIPFAFPTPDQPNFGMQIRSADGLAQPAIYGPVIGTPRAAVDAGGELDFRFRVVAEAGDWYAAYRSVADGVMGWRDYREPGTFSLNDAIFNMIDLFMDDEATGWWKRAKAFYQIEGHNWATQSSPLLPVSLYRLTGDREIYERRALPTLEFLLSRNQAHFTPDPEPGAHPVYGQSSMRGPVNLFGTGSFAPLHQLMNRRTPALRDIARPDDGGVRASKGFNHSQPFEDYIALYQLTGDKTALDEAVKQADAYIARGMKSPPSEVLGPTPFWLIQYTPAWEGLLYLYEATGEKRFLDASAAGARLVMTGIWTQPMPPDESIVIHPGGFCKGDKLDLILHRGPTKSRLGFPVQPGDTPEKSVPAQQVSNVGLGFEQPVTYVHPNNGGRMIMQAPWSPTFLRLARHTGDEDFAVYARNAVVGRWANYPGYYLTTFTDLIQDPRYPFRGPDMTAIYYHHIPVHLTWAIDYLFSEAALLSKNAVQFPSLRQYGYAFFDSLTYGHAPGQIYGEKDVWPWLRRGLVEVANPAFNYLTGHNEKNFYVVLMNQSREPASTSVTISIEEVLGGRKAANAEGIGGDGRLLSAEGNRLDVEVPARGLLALKIPDVNISLPAHRRFPEPRQDSGAAATFVATQDGVEVRAAALQIEPESWDAYLWSADPFGTLTNLSLTWTSSDGRSGTAESVEYPHEISVPVPAGDASLNLEITATKNDGTIIRFPARTLFPGGTQ